MSDNTDRFPRNFPAPERGAAHRAGHRTYGVPLGAGFSVGPVVPSDPAPMRALLDDAPGDGDRAERAAQVLAAVNAPREEMFQNTLDWHTDVWLGWARARGVTPDDAPATAVAEHLVRLGEQRGISSLRHRRQAISDLHQRAGHVDPTRDPLVDRVFEVATRGGKIRELDIRPILAEDYLSIIAGIPMRTLTDLRDRVAIGIGWEALATSNEAAVLPVRGLHFTPDGLMVTFAGKWSRTLTIARRPEFDLVAAVRDWLDRTRIVDGPLLRSVRSQTIATEELAGYSLRKILKTRAAAVGIAADHVTWRSLRNGYLASGLLRDMDEFALAQRAGYGGTMPLRYITRNVLPHVRNH